MHYSYENIDILHTDVDKKNLRKGKGGGGEKMGGVD